MHNYLQSGSISNVFVVKDDVLITHSGCEVLTSLPKSFEDCHIE